MIDVHTHFIPKSVLDKVWHYFDSAGPLVGRALANCLPYRRIPTFADIATIRVRRFTAARLKNAVVLRLSPQQSLLLPQ